jgi:hypothetical protein
VNEDAIPTVRMHAVNQRVVVVHDDTCATTPLAEALSRAFIVRFANSASELGTLALPLDRLTCVVCVLGDSIRARDVHDAFLRLGGRQERLVFVDKSELERSPLALQRTLEVVTGLGEHHA